MVQVTVLTALQVDKEVPLKYKFIIFIYKNNNINKKIYIIYLAWAAFPKDKKDPIPNLV